MIIDDLEKKCDSCPKTRPWECKKCFGKQFILTYNGMKFLEFIDRWLEGTSTIQDIKCNFKEYD